MVAGREDDGIRTEYYSVALIGSSGGGAATIGHGRGGPVDALATVHDELRRVRRDGDDADDDDRDDGVAVGDVARPRDGRRRRMVCAGISHAIFVSLVDGSGFDSVRERDWVPPGDDDECDDDDDDGCEGAATTTTTDGGGPVATLHAVGFDGRDGNGDAPDDDVPGGGAGRRPLLPPFRVTLVARGPLRHINRLARRLDARLGEVIAESSSTSDGGVKTGRTRIAAVISVSSEPTVLHRASLSSCRRAGLPVVGSGGTSLGRIASTYDLRVVGNSGGSVASTTRTKARGWAAGLAEEWGATYHRASSAADDPTGAVDVRARNDEDDNKDRRVDAVVVAPKLRSILEAALPAFLFVGIALRFANAWGGDDDTPPGGDSCLPKYDNDLAATMIISTIAHALRNIVLGTTCCVLAASSTADGAAGGADQSTLLMVSFAIPGTQNGRVRVPSKSGTHPLARRQEYVSPSMPTLQ
jgi:hypothetical protein